MICSPHPDHFLLGVIQVEMIGMIMPTITGETIKAISRGLDVLLCRSHLPATFSRRSRFALRIASRRSCSRSADSCRQSHPAQKNAAANIMIWMNPSHVSTIISLFPSW
jgi:hypothetical protein